MFPPSENNDWRKFFEEKWRKKEFTVPEQALELLKADPYSFLCRYPIQNNFDTQDSGITSAYLWNNLSEGQRPGNILRTFHMHKAESFQIGNQVIANVFGEKAFQVHGVYMGRDPNNPQWYTLNNDGPELMLTAKLTGCTFVARPHDNNPQWLMVTHLRPNEEIDGLKLNRDMNYLYGGKNVYGRLKYDLDTRSVNVIGVRVSGEWRIFAQKLEKQNLVIRKVIRIYPPE